MGKLNYLTVTRPNIIFDFSVVTQFLSALSTTQLEAVIGILRYLKKALGRRFLYSDHGHARVADFSGVEGALLIGGRQHDIVPFFEEILCHGKIRSIVWSLDPV